MDQELIDRRNLALAQLDRIQAFFPRVEGKASFLLALCLAMLSTIAAGFPVRAPTSPRALFAIIAALLLAGAVRYIYRTFFPHLDAASRPSHLFFADIAKMDSEKYIEGLKNKSHLDLFDDAACQIWRNSEILTIKFRSIEVAFRFIGVAIFPWLLFIAATALRAGKFVMPGGGN